VAVQLENEYAKEVYRSVRLDEPLTPGDHWPKGTFTWKVGLQNRVNQARESLDYPTNDIEALKQAKACLESLLPDNSFKSQGEQLGEVLGETFAEMVGMMPQSKFAWLIRPAIQELEAEIEKQLFG